MGRRDRATDLTPWHHVTNRGARRQVIFHNDRQRVLFGGLLGDASERFDVHIVAYCLMDNHFHLVLDAPNGGMSEFMHRVGSAFARHVNDELGTDGPLFCGRFHSRPILSHDYLLNAVRYVHRNPLDVSPSMRLEAYRWSSHRTYLGLRSAPTWLRPELVLDHFPSASSFQDFVTGNRQLLPDAELDPELLLAAIEHVVDETVHRRAVQGMVRNLAILALDFLPPTATSRLDTTLDFGSDDARGRARRRVRAAARQDPELVALLSRAVELLTGCAVSNLTVDTPVTFDTAQPVVGPYGEVA